MATKPHSRNRHLTALTFVTAVLKRMESLNNLPSSTSWSFPPRPWTHHVRWIESDANNPDYVFVAIEAGALIQSRDGGRTWIDRVEQGPYDTHTLVTHPRAPRRLYSSAGDGYYESFDYGESWSRPMEGMKHGYLFGLAQWTRPCSNAA